MANSQKELKEMPNGHLHELFVDELRDILGAERQLLKGLKRMSNAAGSETLKTAFENHYAQPKDRSKDLRKCSPLSD